MTEKIFTTSESRSIVTAERGSEIGQSHQTVTRVTIQCHMCDIFIV